MRPCREFPAYPPDLVPRAIASFEAMPMRNRLLRAESPRALHEIVRTRHPVRQMRAFEPRAVERAPRTREPWLEHPIAIGVLVMALPPAGVAALWASARFSFAGKLAVTLFAAFAMLLAAAVAMVSVAFQ